MDNQWSGSTEHSQVLYTIEAVNIAMDFIIITLFTVFPTCQLDFLFAFSLKSTSIYKLEA